LTREDEIFKQLRSGDPTGLDELIKLYYPEILRYCLWHTPDRATAEDAVQETFLKVIRCLDQYFHRGRFRAFLYKVASNTCTDMWRKRKTFDTLPEEKGYTEPAFEAAESDTDFMLLLNKLSGPHREVLLLRYGQDLTIKEIAAVLDLPLRTVQSRIRSALKALEQQLQKGDHSL
jgi:RNA polymerase sigma factor (sigma-70 family)